MTVEAEGGHEVIFTLQKRDVLGSLCFTALLRPLKFFVSKLMRRRTVLFGMLSSMSFLAMAVDCDQLEKGARSSPQLAIIPSSQAISVTVGNGRIPFFSAPSQHCREKEVFVLPGEKLVTYEEYDQFTYVMYRNPRSGNEASGWVPSVRLKWTGTGIGPN